MKLERENIKQILVVHTKRRNKIYKTRSCSSYTQTFFQAEVINILHRT